MYRFSFDDSVESELAWIFSKAQLFFKSSVYECNPSSILPCCALNRWITELRILIKPMPSADLMFLFDAVLVDMGSCYMGKDEETEGIHWLYWLMVGRHRSDRS